MKEGVPQQQNIGEVFNASEEVNSIRKKLTKEECDQFTELVKEYLAIKKIGQKSSDPFMVDIFNFLKKIPNINNLSDVEYGNLFLKLTYLLQDL